MKKTQRGFTLIELVVVIIILGILAVTAAPKFINLSSDAYKAQLKGAEAAMKGAVTLFKSASEIRSAGTNRVVYEGIRGELGQPWAASSNGTSPSAAYTNPPEIFKAASMDVNDWRYRIFATGTYQVVAAPAGKLDVAQPSQAQVQATNCYIHYIWQSSGTPSITVVDSGC
ncbi:type II secretion system GspH family protein [Shewanella sp. JM162201]|uniref:Type II secretion system GspH family protein n=1 Tax=Shewanella jiangmenensis TaxID=2837387 RepID=A0ABS5V2N5_9GAMM|nr:type II secretion system protein [Shewanella jiangmenensis]MBT1444719.1 type II secretion system GspH family protein [Shewanella jiangmenensis]